MSERDRGLDITTYPDASDFLEALEVPLLEREAQNSLILGVAHARAAEIATGFEAPPGLFACLGSPADPSAILLAIPPGPLLISNAHPDDRLMAELFDAVESAIPIPGLVALTPVANAASRVWRTRRHQVETSRTEEILCRIESLGANRRQCRGQLECAGPWDFGRVLEWSQALWLETQPTAMPDLLHQTGVQIEQGEIFLWQIDGATMGMASGSMPTRNGKRLSSIYVPPEHRGRGIGSSLAGALTDRLLKNASFCVLSVASDNNAARSLYRELGYRDIASITSISFQDG